MTNKSDRELAEFSKGDMETFLGVFLRIHRRDNNQLQWGTCGRYSRTFLLVFLYQIMVLNGSFRATFCRLILVLAWMPTLEAR